MTIQQYISSPLFLLRQLLKIGIITFLWLCFSVPLLLIGAFCFLQTQAGQEFLGKSASNLINSKIVGRVKIQKIEIGLPLRTQFIGTTVHDTDGKLRLAAPLVDFSLEFLPLLKKSIKIDSIQVEDLKFFAFQLSENVFALKIPSPPASEPFIWDLNIEVKKLVLQNTLLIGFDSNQRQFSSGYWDLRTSMFINKNAEGTFSVQWQSLEKGMISMGGEFKFSPELQSLLRAKGAFQISHFSPLKFLDDNPKVTQTKKFTAELQNYGDEQFQLSSQGSLEWNGTFSNSEFNIDHFKLNALGGTITAMGSLSDKKKLSLNLKTSVLDLKLFPWALIKPGLQVSGQLKTSGSGIGTRSNPKIKARIDICNLRIGIPEIQIQNLNPYLRRILNKRSCLESIVKLEAQHASLKIAGRAAELPVFLAADWEGNLLKTNRFRYPDEFRFDLQKTFLKSYLEDVYTEKIGAEASAEASLTMDNLNKTKNASLLPNMHFNLFLNKFQVGKLGVHDIFMSGEALQEFTSLQMVIQKNKNQVADLALRIIPDSQNPWPFPTNYMELSKSKISLDGQWSQPIQNRVDKVGEEKFDTNFSKNDVNKDSSEGFLSVKLNAVLTDRKLSLLALGEVLERGRTPKKNAQANLDFETTIPEVMQTEFDFWLNQPFKSNLKLDIPTLQPMERYLSAIAKARGNLSAQLNWEGTIKSPQLKGHAIGRGLVLVPDSGPAIENASFEIQAAENDIDLKSLELERGGKVHIRGKITGFRPAPSSVWNPNFELSVSTEKLKVSPLNSLSPTLTADIEAKGQLDTLGRAQTTLNLKTLELYIPALASAVPQQGNNSKPLPDIVILGRNTKIVERSSQDSPTQLVKEVSLILSAPKGIIVKGPDVQIDSRAAFDIHWQDKSGVTISGEAKLRRPGFVKALGRRFDIKSASYAVRGQKPELGLISLLLIQKNDVALAKFIVAGTPKKPEITLQSEPELPQKDIASLLLTGYTSSQISDQVSAPDNSDKKEKSSKDKAASMAATAVANKLSNELFGSFMEKTDLVLSVDVKNAETGAANIGVGKYVTDGLFLSVEKKTGIEKGENDKEIRFDYNLTPDWSVEGVVGDEQKGTLDLIWEKRF